MRMIKKAPKPEGHLGTNLNLLGTLSAKGSNKETDSRSGSMLSVTESNRPLLTGSTMALITPGSDFRSLQRYKAHFLSALPTELLLRNKQKVGLEPTTSGLQDLSNCCQCLYILISISQKKRLSGYPEIADSLLGISALIHRTIVIIS